MAKMSIKKKRLVKGVKCCREDKEGKMSTRDLEIKPSLVILLRFSTKKLKKKKTHCSRLSKLLGITEWVMMFSQTF